MWSQIVKINWNEMQLEVEVLLEEGDLRYREDADGNRAQNQPFIKIIEINTITNSDGEIFTWDEFTICFIENLAQYDELMRILKEKINEGELC